MSQHQTKQRPSLGMAAMLFSLLWSTWVHAGAFGVNPVRLTLSAQQPTAVVTVKNDGAEPAVIQLKVVAWGQRNGQDLYTPTQDVLASPPIFSVPPGEAQIVRVGMRHWPDQQRELAYRLYVQEVPPPPKPGIRLQTALRIGIPIFFTPPVTAAPGFRWYAGRTSQGTIRLGLTNTGNAHMQITSLTLSWPGSEQISTTQNAGLYLFPAQTHHWHIQPDIMPPPGSPLRLTAQTDAGEVQAEIVLEETGP